MNLSAEQLKIVMAPEPQIAVIGPPGTGKTRVLTERIRYLLKEGLARPSDIVAITFTNFAANEMKSRLSEFNSDDMFIGTMHSYATQLLFNNGYGDEVIKLLNETDFSELIIKATKEPVKNKVIKYLFVDEVQDLCNHEFEFIKSLYYENIFMGGDADQCIYQFKGSNPKLFNDFCRNKNTTTYILTKNFRCGQNIVDFSRYYLQGIPNRIDVQVEGNLTERGWVKHATVEEAIWELCNSHTLGNWFILTRTNAELEQVAKLLEYQMIPFVSFKQKDLTNEEIEQLLNNNVVKLLTIHAAKGLESDRVIVIGSKVWNVEEKCISYVAATRARKLLYWCPSIGGTRKAPRKIATKKTGISWE
jgi:superfamily I DNA/RNA helicase